MLRLTQFGYNTTVAIWLLPIFALAAYGNATSTGSASDLYAIVAAVSLVLLAFHAVAAWNSSGQTASSTEARQRVQSTHPDDAAVVSFENLSAWKWAICLLVSILAVVSAGIHYGINRSSEGGVATFMLFYAFIDLAVAWVAFSQFWAIKKGQIVQLTNKAADSMFQH